MPLSCAILTILSLGSALAQQQTPAQNAPASHDYTAVAPVDKTWERLDESQNSQVQLTWQPISGAVRYVVQISRQADLQVLFFIVETINTTYLTPQMPPGQYFYRVEGYAGDRLVGFTPTQPFVIGKPLTVQALKKEKLPAPAIISPKDRELFPTYGYVRLSWETVAGARGYRFRIWDEDQAHHNARWKRDTPPIWTTEVSQPWIELHDVPYSSYMYLGSGLYRWDVAAVDRDGGYVGDAAMGYFQMSRNWFLKPEELILRLQYGFSPTVKYQQGSAERSTQYQLSGTGHSFGFDFDRWFARQWGFNGGVEMRSFLSRAPDETTSSLNANLDALFRAYTSHVPWGWTIVLATGLSLSEFPQIDAVGTSADDVHVSRPKVLGAKFGFRAQKHFDSPWELHLLGATRLPLSILNSPTGGATAQSAFDGDLTLRALYGWTRHFATGLGFTSEHHGVAYVPDGFRARSSVAMSGWNLNLLFQFDYYPVRGAEAYYPASESRSAQRWRPRTP